MQNITVEKFAELTLKHNKSYSRKELVDSLHAALLAKQKGAVCVTCGAPIWAAGSAISGINQCLTCMTGEADSSEDYEII